MTADLIYQAKLSEDLDVDFVLDTPDGSIDAVRGFRWFHFPERWADVYAMRIRWLSVDWPAPLFEVGQKLASEGHEIEVVIDLPDEYYELDAYSRLDATLPPCPDCGCMMHCCDNPDCLHCDSHGCWGRSQLRRDAHIRRRNPQKPLR
jgi:hypothetical protein